MQLTSFLHTVHIVSIMSCMIRHKGLQTWSSAIVFSQCSIFENWGSPQASHRLTTTNSPVCLGPESSRFMCAGESSLLLFFRFSIIQNDGTESDFFCFWLWVFCAFLEVRLSLLQLFACRLRFFPTLWLWTFLFVVSPSAFKLKSLVHFEFHWVGVWEISTLHIIPGHMYPIRLPIYFLMELFLKKCQM